MEQRRVRAGKTGEAESSLLYDLAGIFPARRYFADLLLFLRDDGRLRDCLLAADHFEEAVRTERSSGDAFRCVAVSCRLCDAATERVALRQNLRAALACGGSDFSLRIDFVAGGYFWFEHHDRGHFVHFGGSQLFCISPLFLGSADCFFE